MIYITRTATGILLQKDAAEILIDGPAVSLALGPIIHELIDSGRACGEARRVGYEAGLIDGRERALIEWETRERIQERIELDEYEDALAAMSALAA